jgi:cytochrome P450 family 6
MIAGEEWKPVRNQLAPLFTAARTKFAIPIMNDIGKKMLEYLDGGAENLETIEVKELASKYLTDVIACHAFGIDGECFTNPEPELRKIGHAIFNPTFWNGIRDIFTLILPDVNKYLKIPFVSGDVDKRVRNLVNQVLKERQEKGIKKNDLLQSILEIKEKNPGGLF